MWNKSIKLASLRVFETKDSLHLSILFLGVTHYLTASLFTDFKVFICQNIIFTLMSYIEMNISLIL